MPAICVSVYRELEFVPLKGKSGIIARLHSSLLLLPITSLSYHISSDDLLFL